MFSAHPLIELMARRKAAALELQQHLAGVGRLSLSQYTERRARGEVTVEQAYAYTLKRKREAQVSFAWFALADAIGLAQGQRVAALLCVLGAIFFLAVLVDSELALWRLRGGVGGLAQLARTRGWWHGLFDGERFGLRLNTVQVKA
jgi:hypothetical protein